MRKKWYFWPMAYISAVLTVVYVAIAVVEDRPIALLTAAIWLTGGFFWMRLARGNERRR